MRKFCTYKINKEIKNKEMKDILTLIKTDWVFDLLYVIINEGKYKEVCQYNENDVLERFIEIRINNRAEYKKILNKMEDYGAIWVVKDKIIVNRKYDKEIINYLMFELKKRKKINYSGDNWELIKEKIKESNRKEITIENIYRIPQVKELDEHIKKIINKNRLKKIKEITILWGKNENRESKNRRDKLY